MDQDQSRSTRPAALASELTAEIAAARYPIGSRFPAEQALQERFGVGRHTVREALKLLTEQGLIGRRRKTGTVVLSHRPVSHYVHSLRDIHSLFDFARSTRLDIRHEGFVTFGEDATGEMADLPDRRWMRFAGRRATRHDGAPLCWSEIMVPERFTPDREAVRRDDRAVYEIVCRQYGLKLDHVEQKVAATALPAGVADILNAPAGSPALLLTRRYVAHTGATFEISYNLYPAERFSLRTIIRQRA